MKLTTNTNRCKNKKYKKSCFLRFWGESPKGAFLACPTTQVRFLFILSLTQLPVGPPFVAIMAFNAWGSFFIASCAFFWYFSLFQSFSVTSISWTVLLFFGSFGSWRVMRDASVCSIAKRFPSRIKVSCDTAGDPPLTWCSFAAEGTRRSPCRSSSSRTTGQ